MSIINKIVEIASSKNISQQILCDKMGISSGTFSTWKARQTDPPAKYLACICEALGVSLDYLLTGKEKSLPAELSEDKQNLLEMFDLLTEREKGIIIGEMRTMTRERTESKNVGSA